MGARQVIALGTATLGALAALNSALTPAPPPTPFERAVTRRFAWSHGDVHYGENGTGPAVLLVHSLGLTASSYEMRYLVSALAEDFHVYTPDLLGFGRSARPAMAYTAELYGDLLRDFMREVSGPSLVIAAGLSASYALAVAVREPQLVKSLVLSAPPACGEPPPLTPLLRQTVDRTRGMPLLGQSAFHLLTARSRVRASLRNQLYANPELVTESMVDVHTAMARQTNAHCAGLALLAGHLDLDVRELLPAVQQPLLLVFGTAMHAAADRAAAYVRLHAAAQVLMMDRAAYLPHEEQAERFAAAAKAWFQR